MNFYKDLRMTPVGFLDAKRVNCDDKPGFHHPLHTKSNKKVISLQIFAGGFKGVQENDKISFLHT